MDEGGVGMEELEDIMHSYLEALNIKVFENVEHRQRFIDLFIEKTKLERQLFMIQKELEKYKDINDQL
jgi:hypothetical protein